MRIGWSNGYFVVINRSNVHFGHYPYYFMTMWFSFLIPFVKLGNSLMLQPISCKFHQFHSHVKRSHPVIKFNFFTFFWNLLVPNCGSRAHDVVFCVGCCGETTRHDRSTRRESWILSRGSNTRSHSPPEPSQSYRILCEWSSKVIGLRIHEKWFIGRTLAWYIQFHIECICLLSNFCVIWFIIIYLKIWMRRNRLSIGIQGWR